MHFRRIFLLLFSILMPSFRTSMTLAQALDANARAREILAQTRAALGGDAALKSVQSLSALGDFRSGSGTTLASGDVQLDLLLPDKLMRIMKWSPVKDLKVTTVETMNGSQIWTDSKEKQSGQALPGNGPGGIGGLGRRGGRGRGSAGSGGSGQSGTEKGDSAPAPNLRDNGGSQQIFPDFSCITLGLLFHLPDSSKVEAIPETDDDVGDVTADFVKIDIGHGTVVRLALDQKTHRPVMAAYDIPVEVDGERGGEDASGSTTTKIQIYFSEYKPIAKKGSGNIWLPHQMTKARNGLTVEDMHIKKFQLNPHLKPKQFQQKLS